MDVIAALVFGIVVINALRDEGVTQRRAIKSNDHRRTYCRSRTSTRLYFTQLYWCDKCRVIGLQENGGAVLALASTVLYGTSGTAILAVTIIFACLTTSLDSFLHVLSILNKFSLIRTKYMYLFAGVSAIISNIGLTQLISISVPVLMMVYPLAIVLMLMSFIDKPFGRKPIVYILALIATAIVSIFDGLLVAEIDVKPVTSLLAHLPLYEQQIGWLVPAIIGALVGVVISHFLRNEFNYQKFLLLTRWI